MSKKIIIPSLAFFAMSAMAFYTAKMEGPLNKEDKDSEVNSYEPVVVLELFTSQGCSSCPPADVLLDKVKKEYPDEIFALSYHVDYWNYIGWEDPFSKSAYTKKQRGYNLKFRSRSNYTPQVVVNGQEHFVGSNASKMYGKIKSYSSNKAENRIVLDEVIEDGQKVNFKYRIEGNLTGKQLRAVLVLDERTTSVKRGENRNRTLKNSNIVVAEKYVIRPDSKGFSFIEIPPILSKNERFSLMLISESQDLTITGAAKSKLRG